ncbi:LlaJI family restriction endonuclease [Lactobacillus apis]|uniref:LlaJI family restriction endonuclease n=1 Tax=Lactobacillus apis TaxID=303541 RepID=UPI00242F8526|nr:LlaJI family restriction endonuclease [Lactobacillus apis]
MKIMSNINIVAIQEGAVIPDNIVNKYHLTFADVDKNANFERISSFCGVVRRGTSILVSFPKHYINLDEFNQLPNSDKLKHIRLILKTIVSYELNPAYSSFRKKDDLNTSFSFSSFFSIYNYFQKYGLYMKKRGNIKKGYSGKISWKDTIHKSQKVISNGNLVFFPFFVRQHISDEDFITNCMVFAINYTEEIFGDLLDLPDNSAIAVRGVERLLRENKEAVIFKLGIMRREIFKDIDKKLLDDLINFFRGINDNPNNVRDIKHYHFNNVWEKAVENYLNNHFVKIEDNKLIFGIPEKVNRFSFKKLVLKNYNNVSGHKNDTLQPDHYYYDESKKAQYIFDSKYYNNIYGLNHKQFVYHMILSNRAQKTYDALIMPNEGQTFTEVYLDLATEYLPEKLKEVKILLTHLRTQDVLKDFTET